MAKAELNGGEMKEYKRLTKSGCYCGDEIDWEDVEEIYDRLAEFENAIESGELVRVPCKVGDTVYAITQGCKPNRILTETVTHAKFKYRDGEFVDGYICTLAPKGELDNCYFLNKYGKVWFTDKAQAEAKLKELEGKK